jgi:hypothetical protein
MTNKNYSQRIGTLAGMAGAALVLAFAGIAYVGSSVIGCKPLADPNQILTKVERLGNLEVRASSNRAGRRVILTDSQKEKTHMYYGISAVDKNRDGRFDEIYVDVDKGDNLEHYVSLEKLEQLYSHAVKFGEDYDAAGKKEKIK